ncbi:hypothetical protein GCM10009090_31350 [[Pseudomonas] boreopolis]|uniref:Uncharacterized protein n=1 Tax=Xanthomonas boreopolis TaxID=86183 RepID=A0A919FAD6_9XANT|nr:hypothetical protein GCM10009090_31350 [[Pseudomonas] boreopolis]
MLPPPVRPAAGAGASRLLWERLKPLPQKALHEGRPPAKPASQKPAAAFHAGPDLPVRSR